MQRNEANFVVKYNLRGAPMNNEEKMTPTSSPSDEDRQPAEVESKHLDAETFWRAYPLMLGKSQIAVVN